MNGMINIPQALSRRPGYETFAATCPWCRQENVFSRVSDLSEISFDYQVVLCEHQGCRKRFSINGDSVNPPHEMLFLECYDLFESKRYMHCIVTLAQAHEVFFKLYLEVELLWKPFSADEERDIARLNRLALKLDEKVERKTFGPMRDLFLHVATHGPTPKNLDEAEKAIFALRIPREKPHAQIESVPDTKRAALLKAVSTSTIDQMRNKVVHKRAFRPTREEAEAALKTSRPILFGSRKVLDLYDDLNYYMMRAPKASQLV